MGPAASVGEKEIEHSRRAPMRMYCFDLESVDLLLRTRI